MPATTERLSPATPSSAAAPSVSVVIAAYNAGPYLDACLRSVFAQSRRPSEVIVVDDGSSDDTRAVAARHPVRLLSTGGRRGSLTARAVGVASATGAYVALNDADDLWAPDHLEATAGLLDRFPEAGLAGSHAQEFGAGRALFAADLPSDAPRDVFWRAYASWLVPFNTVVARRGLLLDAMRDHDRVARYAIDFLVTMRLARRAPMIGTGRVTAYWRRHGTQMSTQKARQHADMHAHRAHFVEETRRSGATGLARRLREFARCHWMSDVADAYCDLDDLAHLVRVGWQTGLPPQAALLRATGRVAYLRSVRPVLQPILAHLPGPARRLHLPTPSAAGV